MGLPFLALSASGAVAVMVVVVLVFVAGEMLWAPSSEALVTRLAPAGMRGVYLGTMGAATWAGAALTPATGLSIRERWGDGAMWIVVALTSVVAAALYARAAAHVSDHARVARVVSHAPRTASRPIARSSVLASSRSRYGSRAASRSRPT
jgi:dipeptide/tripeptide permease